MVSIFYCWHHPHPLLLICVFPVWFSFFLCVLQDCSTTTTNHHLLLRKIVAAIRERRSSTRARCSTTLCIPFSLVCNFFVFFKQNDDIDETSRRQNNKIQGKFLPSKTVLSFVFIYGVYYYKIFIFNSGNIGGDVVLGLFFHTG